MNNESTSSPSAASDWEASAAAKNPIPHPCRVYHILCMEMNGGHSCTHVWSGHGRYQLRDGSERRRQRCSRCRTTRVVNGGRRRGAQPGRTRVSSAQTTYAEFWTVLERRFTQVGLTRAAMLAADQVGVEGATIWRWMKCPRPELTNLGASVEPLRLALLDTALHVYRMSFRPATQGSRRAYLPQPELRHWVNAAGEMNKRPRLQLREHGRWIWAALQRATVVASVVRGKPFPGWIRELVPEHTDPWLRYLSDDLIPAIPERARDDDPLRYWLLWGSRQSCRCPDPKAVTVVAATRRRIAGIAAVRIGDTPEDPVSIRLQPSRAQRREMLVGISVAVAPHISLGCPLVLDLSKPATVEELHDFHVGITARDESCFLERSS